MERKIWDACLLPLTHVLRDTAPGYHFASNGQKVNHILFMDDLKLYASNEKSLESLIQTGLANLEWKNVQY